MSFERQRAWQSHAQEIHEDGREKKNASSMHECISCTIWCVFWSVGCCHPKINPKIIIIHNDINISTWTYNKCLFGPKKNLTTPVQYNSSKPESLKAAQNKYYSTRRTCPAAASYRIVESIEWRLFNKKTLRVSVTLMVTISLQRSITMTTWNARLR